jgi:acetolactate synthase-1/2/3 large subunit
VTERLTGGQTLVETLKSSGVDRVFCVPGESYLAVLDAFRDESAIDVICCRHESGAGLMAVADARLTGNSSACFVSRGPGAANATLAIHVAQQDAAPVLFFVGQVERSNLGRGAFQEVDYVRMYSDMAKWSVEVHDPSRLSEIVARAVYESTAGTPGPVVVSLPEDMLNEHTDAPIVSGREGPIVEPGANELHEMARMLREAERPIILAGGRCEPHAARAALLEFSESWSVPVAATNKHQCVFPNDHPNWIAHIGFVVPGKLAGVLAKSDLVVALGSRLGDLASQGYTFPRAPEPDQPLIHIYPDTGVVGRNHRVDLGIIADICPTLSALRNLTPGNRSKRQSWLETLRSTRDDLTSYSVSQPPDGLDFGVVALELDGQLEDDAIITLDAGNFVSWVHSFMRFRPTQEMIGAVGGAMGIGVPAAVAASLRHPERQVVALVGDGGFMMTGNELATAVAMGARPKIIIANNGSYGVIRAQQERIYPGRVMATDLVNPDFAALARSFGVVGMTLENLEHVSGTITEALATEGPCVVDVKTSILQISAFQRLESGV